MTRKPAAKPAAKLATAKPASRKPAPRKPAAKARPAKTAIAARAAALAPAAANEPVIGIIGGSGLYDIEGVEEKRWRKVVSPWGTPSGEMMFGRLHGVRCVFLPRHDRGHRLSPTDLPYRANIDALKRVGVTEILSLSAVGSLREDLPPGHFVIVDQFIDRTFARPKSFFGEGCVAHVSMANPVCRRLGDHLESACQELGLPHRRGGTYLAMEGPQFSTRAESELYRSWGCSVIGMTNMPEAKLAREAELCYATVAMVTDYDCWHPEHDHVTVEAVVKVLFENASKARALVKAVVPKLSGRTDPCWAGCHTALENAIITAPDKRDPGLLKKLDMVAGRVLAERA
ncbi:MAG: S-methyl-5'-thioadenosine phosphorylase [Alphaproteobacteria bacterium]|nr:S-methyl-5'-thioadenosine phosphorylase [Alphaproteobacteria bacterium]